MRTSSDFLWRLVQSMSSTEKLFFKRNFTASAQPGQRIYVQLFSAIARQKNYDEGAILEKFGPAINKKNIAFQKHYLQSRIGEALISFDARNSAQQEIYNQLLLVRILRKKGLPDEAHSTWKKAIAGARKIESFSLLSLLKTEFEKIILFSNLHTAYDDLHKIFKSNIISYNEYAEMISLRDIYTEALLLKRKAHFDFDDELKKKINSLLQRVNESESVFYGRSFWFRHYFRMNKATLLYLLNDTETSFTLLKQSWEDWKEHAQFVSTDAEFYIELLYMINYAGILKQEFSYVEGVFHDELNNRITEPVQRANFEVIRFLALNKIYNKTARYDKVEKLIDLMKVRFKEWEPVLNSDLNRTTNISLGISCFVLERYADAHYYIKRAITWFRESTRKEHSAIANILLLLTTYNLQNSKLFDAQYRSTYSYFYKQKKKHPFETALVQCLHRTFYMKDEKSRISEYKKTLEIFEKNKDDIVQQITFTIFNYPGWLMSKVQRIPYRYYVEKKVRSQNQALPSVVAFN